MFTANKQKSCTISTKQSDTLYYSKLSHASFYRFLAHFGRYYIYHYLAQRYRRDIPHIEYRLPQIERWRWRWHGAISDAVYNILLDGYTELTGLPVSLHTGQMLFLLIELTKCLDEHLDSRLAQSAETSLTLQEMLAFPELHQQLTIFCRYLEHFGRAEPILHYLKTQFTTQYERHIQALKTARNSLAFEDVLNVAYVDNGGWLRAVMEVVRLFNGHEVDENILADYSFFGMAGKFTDDMVDLLCDIKQGYLNLLYSLLLQTPTELATFELAVRQKKRLGFSWWSQHCSQTYTRYFTSIASYYNQLRSSQLRLAYDLMMLLPRFGYNLDPTR